MIWMWFVKYNKVVGTDQDRINQLLQKNRQ